MATLVVTEGPVSGQKYNLESHPIVLLGRSDDCTFQLVDARVSRKHMQLRRSEDGSHTLVHYSKSSPTYRNGTSVTEPVQLDDGDEIRIGETTLIYTLHEDANAQTARDAWFRKGQRFKTSISDEDPGAPEQP